MRKIVIFMLFIITIFSCKTKKDKIEIYLLTNRIESFEGIPIEVAFKKEKDISTVLNKFKGRNVRFDTIQNEWVFAGIFKASKKDLESKPLISDKEILNFNRVNSELEVSQSAYQKLIKINTRPKNGIGRQFVICINDKPKIFGYFFNDGFNSYWSTTYQLLYIRHSNNYKKSYILDFRVGKKFRALDSINERELFTSFKNSNRLN